MSNQQIEPASTTEASVRVLPKYRVLKQLQNRDFVHVAFRDELDHAVDLVRGLAATWPGEYAVRDAEGNDVRVSDSTRTRMGANRLKQWK